MSKKRKQRESGGSGSRGDYLVIENDQGLLHWNAEQSAYILLPPGLVPGVWMLVKHLRRPGAEGSLARALEVLLSGWEAGDRLAMMQGTRLVVWALFEMEVLP